MKKVLFLFACSILFISCKENQSSTDEMFGNWVQKEFLNAIINKENLSAIKAEKLELILSKSDSNYYLVRFGEKAKKGKFEFYKSNHLVIKDFFGIDQNADIKLVQDELHLYNSFTSDTIIFSKLDDQLYKDAVVTEYSIKSIPFIHHQYISGSYQLDTNKVVFTDEGKIRGLGKIINYSLCYEMNCAVDSMNTIFLSDKDNVGNYYAFERRGDSLIVFDIDSYAVLRGMKSGKNGIKFAMKKIN
jgi:hypothetical protein